MLYLVSISQNLTIKWLGQIVECQHWLHFLSLVVQFEILMTFPPTMAIADDDSF